MRKVIYAISIAMFLGASLASCGSDGNDSDLNDTRFPDGSTFTPGDGPEIALDSDGNITLAAKEYYFDVFYSPIKRDCKCCQKLYTNGIPGDWGPARNLTDKNNCNYNGTYLQIIDDLETGDVRTYRFKCRDSQNTPLFLQDCDTFDRVIDGETF